MRIGGEIQRKEKEKRIAQIYTKISVIRETERTNLRVTEYRYPLFDWGERLAKQKSHKNNVRKRINLYIQDHPIQ